MSMEEKRMNKNEELYVANAATKTMAESTNVTPPEVTTMENNTAHKKADKPSQITMALRDGLIALAGLGVAAGGVMNQEITMWWVGA